MTTLVNSFEGGTAGTAIIQGSGGNSGPGSGSYFDAVAVGAGATLAFDNTHGGAHGSLSAQVATSSTAAASYVLWGTQLGSQTTVWFRQYLYFASLPAGSCNLLLTTNSANNLTCAFLNVSATGHIGLVNSAGSTIHTMTTAVPTGAWFRIEGFITGDPSVGQVSLQIYTVPDSTVPVESYTSPATQNTGAAIGQFAFGVYFTASNVQYWMDDIGLSTGGYLGPVIVPTYLPVQAQPPGMISPAAMPFAGPSFLPNDAVVAGAPYLMGTGTAAGTGVTVAITTGSNPGDTIVVFAAGTSTGAPQPTVSDSAGNVYSATAIIGGSGTRANQMTAVNPVPLTAGSTVTASGWAAGPPHDVKVVGIPGGAFGAPGSNAVPDQVTTNFTLNTQTSTAVSATWPSAPAEVAFCWVNAYPSGTAGPLNFPPGWTVLSVSLFGSAYVGLAYMFVPRGGTARASFTYAGAPTAGVVTMSTYALETRYATQPGTLSGPPQPPGFLAPGSGPDMPPLLPGTLNDVPPPANAPYLIGTAYSNNAGGTSLTIPVTRASSPRDAVVVLVTAGLGTGRPAGASDTQGNAYAVPVAGSGPAMGACVAQNTAALSPANGDAVTVTWSVAHAMLAIVVGVPASAVGGAGGQWLTTDLLNQVGIAGGSAVAPAVPATGAPGVPEVVIAFGATPTVASGVPAFGQDFAVIGTTAWTAATAITGAVAYKIASGIAPNSAVAWTQQVAGGNNGLLYVTFRLETRVAPNRPYPDMPPGTLSPGAWQFTPQRQYGSGTGIKYNPGPNKWPAVLPAASTSNSAIVRGTGKNDAAQVTVHGAQVRADSRVMRAVVTALSVVKRGAGKYLTSNMTSHSATTRRTGKLLRSSAGTHTASARKTSKQLVSSVVARGLLNRSRRAVLDAVARTNNAMSRQTGKLLITHASTHSAVNRLMHQNLTAGVTAAGVMSIRKVKLLAAQVRVTSRMLLPRLVPILRAMSARFKWRSSGGRGA